MDPIIINIKKRMMMASGWQTLEVCWKGPGGAVSTLFGPSGVGKTTLLRMIAGLSSPDEGTIMVGNEVWFDSGRNIDLLPQQRSIGFVFQEYSLFPNMTVRENIRYALPSKTALGRLDDLLVLAGMNELSASYPAQLSGGQQQRVALVRALARNPRILLLDEPLSALDGPMRASLQDLVLDIQKRTGVTVLMVSHEISEVFKMSAMVVVLKDGRVQATGRPQEVFAPYAVSGKFKFVAEVVDVFVDGFVSIFSLRVGNDIVRVIDTDIDAGSILAGDRVVVASKAFNPVIIKCEARVCF